MTGPDRRKVLLTLTVGAAAWTSAGCAAAGAPQAALPSPGPSDTGSARKRAASGALVKPLRGKIIVIDPGHNGGNADHPGVINAPVDIDL